MSQITHTIQNADCSICLNHYDIPVVLDCNHTFCFLCIKEVNLHGMTCPLCRNNITIDLGNVFKDLRDKLQALVGKDVWLYASVSGDGWWMYNLEMNQNIENAYQQSQNANNAHNAFTCQIRVAARTYDIDFTQQKQHFQNKERRIQRVTFDMDKIKEINIKGMAGVFFQKIQEQIGKFII